MIANYLGYDFMGSDIKINYAIENTTRRKTNKFYKAENTFDIFSHDIKEKLEDQLKGKDILVVTE
jgi:hypothetical protein